MSLARRHCDSEFAEGILYFFARIPFLRATIVMIAVSNFTVAGVQFGVIVLAKRDGLSSTVVGGFVALVSFPTLLGSLASPLFRRFLSLNAIMLSELWAAVGYAAFLVWPNVCVTRRRLRRAGVLLPQHRLRCRGLTPMR